MRNLRELEVEDTFILVLVSGFWGRASIAFFFYTGAGASVLPLGREGQGAGGNLGG